MARRRAHTKSRLGCSQCKRRKVKCDEKHPSCFNCSRQGVLCSFLGTRPPSATKGAGFATAVHTFAGGASSSVQGSIHGALGESPCGEQNLPSGELNISNIGNNTRIEFLADGELSTRLPGSWARDLELMHHFCTYTSVTMSHHDGVRHIWKKTIPVEAYDHHYVMHGILSLASLHKAYLLPGKRDEYLTRAAYHHNMGQQNFRALLPNVMEDNWRPIFCFSLIIVAYVCCLPAQSENSSTAGSIAKALELFTVTRGIKATLMPYLKLLSRTDLAPLTHSVWLANVGLSINGWPSLENSVLPHDFYDALDCLRLFFSGDTSLENRSDYEEAVSTLTISAMHIAHAGVHLEVGATLMWPFLLPESVMIDLRALKPHATVLLSYYAVILRSMDGSYWFFRGTARDLMKDIESRLEREQRFQQWLV